MFLTGVAYYPEDWSRERIVSDAKMMKETGMTLVRIAEFAWSHMEISDGKFTFDWLHEAFRIFQSEGLRVILCTPTSAAPPWLVHDHPEILKIGFRGEQAYLGVRDHTCYTSEVYRAYAARLIEKMAEQFKSYPNLYAWQIDNEIGHSIFGNCSCEACQKAFREFLRRKYGSVEALNRAWGNTFWSLEYSGWEQIGLGDLDCRLNSAQVLDSQRFRSQSMIDFVANQLRVIRKYCPSVPIVTSNYAQLGDQHEAFKHLDGAGGDFYISAETSLTLMSWCCDQYRGFKPGVAPWLLEASTSPWEPSENLLEFLMWHFLARGFDHQVYFHWRTHPGGFEKSHPTFIGFSGKPRLSCRRFAAAMKKITPLLEKYGDLPLPRCEAAVIFDFDSQYSYAQGIRKRAGEYGEAHLAAYKVLLELGINADIVAPDTDISGYKMLVIPIQPHFSPEFAAKLRDFVRGGGILLLGGESGIYDDNSKYILEQGPEHLREVFGMEIDDFIVFNTLLPDGTEPADLAKAREVRFSGTLDGVGISGTANRWIASVSLRGAEALLSFENTVFQGMPFLTENRFGQGSALYFGTVRIDPASLKMIAAHAARLAGIKRLDLPENVEAVTRGPLTFILNYNTEPVSFRLPLKGHSVLNGFFCDGHVEIPAHEVCVVENS